MNVLLWAVLIVIVGVAIASVLFRVSNGREGIGQAGLLVRVARAWYLLTGHCRKFRPGANGICQVCRVPPAGYNSSEGGESHAS